MERRNEFQSPKARPYSYINLRSTYFSKCCLHSYSVYQSEEHRSRSAIQSPLQYHRQLKDNMLVANQWISVSLTNLQISFTT
ncbi:hypothetical protein T10_6573 [Trichinella papuae]|uniref:Uncharacterized protein n=1 Tax=Trichinella papuae TaxID=268474 RepID=A0A0V1M8N7_9BILA|nr:hypothetical protein T10_6573 [Trichinella papuae]